MAWIPPISLTQSLEEITKKFKTKEGRKDMRKTGLTVLAAAPVGISLGLGILWSMGRMSYGTWDYKQWPEIKEKIKTEYQESREIQENNALDIQEFFYKQ